MKILQNTGLIILILIIILLCVYLWRRSITTVEEPFRNVIQPLWMTQLPEDKKKIPINRLMIPGSHDSAMYNVSNITKDVDGQPTWAKYMKNVSFLTRSAENWAITQGHNIYRQLEQGVRYLDIRVAWSPEINQFVTVHSFGGPLLSDVLTDIKTFSEKFDTEMLLIKFETLYTVGEDKQLNIRLMEFVKGYLSDNMVDNTKRIDKTSINDMYLLNKNIFVFNDYWAANDRMFHINPFYGKWVDSDNIAIKQKSFVSQIEKFSQDKLYENGIMLIDWTYTAPRGQALLSMNNLKSHASDVNKHISSFVLSLSPEAKKHIGVITADYVGCSNFIQYVIDLNYSPS